MWAAAFTRLWYLSAMIDRGLCGATASCIHLKTCTDDQAWHRFWIWPIPYALCPFSVNMWHLALATLHIEPDIPPFAFSIYFADTIAYSIPPASPTPVHSKDEKFILKIRLDTGRLKNTSGKISRFPQLDICTFKICSCYAFYEYKGTRRVARYVGL